MIKRERTLQVHQDSPIALSPSSWFQCDVLGIIHSSYEVFPTHTAPIADVIFASVVFACQRWEEKKRSSPCRCFFSHSHPVWHKMAKSKSCSIIFKQGSLAKCSARAQAPMTAAPARAQPRRIKKSLVGGVTAGLSNKAFTDISARSLTPLCHCTGEKPV